VTLGRNYIHKFLIFLICFGLSSCEIKFLTASLWENSYEEEIATFLVSTDERYIAFLGKRYHYVFAYNSGVLRQLINLDHDNLIEIDTKRTRLELSSKNEIRGRIIFKSFDKKLSPNSINLLESLGFQSSEEE